MAPPAKVFPASELPERVQFGADNKRRKPVDASSASARIDLSACELLEMMQWSCEVAGDGPADRPVTCVPVPRYFRRCQDAKGTFMVETTSWEGTVAKDKAADTSAALPSGSQSDQRNKPVVGWSPADKAPW